MFGAMAAVMAVAIVERQTYPVRHRRVLDVHSVPKYFTVIASERL